MSTVPLFLLINMKMIHQPIRAPKARLISFGAPLTLLEPSVPFGIWLMCHSSCTHTAVRTSHCEKIFTPWVRVSGVFGHFSLLPCHDNPLAMSVEDRCRNVSDLLSKGLNFDALVEALTDPPVASKDQDAKVNHSQH